MERHGGSAKPLPGDFSGLTLFQDVIPCTVTILFHEDPYRDLQLESARPEHRDGGRGGLPAVEYRVRAKRQPEGSLKGSHTVTVGVSWSTRSRLIPAASTPAP